MYICISEVGEELSGKFEALFRNEDGTEHILKLDTNNDIEYNFLMGKHWFQFYTPEQMNLYIGVEYKDVPIEYGRKVYKNLVLNGWTI